ncbi:MAG: hypothetical protein HC819_16615 [Cyclobacteriaceae bacterium]|nr:hypothetical protein [Cyclobacteriaceae bacterium]
MQHFQPGIHGGAHPENMSYAVFPSPMSGSFRPGIGADFVDEKDAIGGFDCCFVMPVPIELGARNGTRVIQQFYAFKLTRFRFGKKTIAKK